MTLHVPVGHDMLQFTHVHVSDEVTRFFSLSLHFFRLSHCMLRFMVQYHMMQIVSKHMSIDVTTGLSLCQCKF